MAMVESLQTRRVYNLLLSSRCLRSAACSLKAISSRRKFLPTSSAALETKSKSIRGKRGTAQKSKVPGEQVEAAVPDTEQQRRKRRLDPVTWSAKTAETMLLYKDGEL